jgi:FixJ family two-component response regulator
LSWLADEISITSTQSTSKPRGSNNRSAATASGRVNKQVAFDLGISEVTVKLHRANVMRKMEAASISELIRIWESLSIREAGAETR